MLGKKSYLDRIGWSIEREFDGNILLWLVATDLVHHFNKETLSPILDFEAECCKNSFLLFNYIISLLAKKPSMLHNGIGKKQFWDTIAEASKFFDSQKSILS